MKCNRCGAELRDGSNFCNFCGNVIEQNNTHTSSGGFTDVFTPINNVNNNINSNNNNPIDNNVHVVKEPSSSKFGINFNNVQNLEESSKENENPFDANFNNIMNSSVNNGVNHVSSSNSNNTNVGFNNISSNGSFNSMSNNINTNVNMNTPNTVNNVWSNSTSNVQTNTNNSNTFSNSQINTNVGMSNTFNGQPNVTNNTIMNYEINSNANNPYNQNRLFGVTNNKSEKDKEVVPTNNKKKKSVIGKIGLVVAAISLFALLYMFTDGFAFLLGKRTMMIYMIGSDLESEYAAASMDIEEIMKSGIDYKNVNVLIYTGGSKNWANEAIQEDKNAIFKVTEKGLEKLEEFEKSNMTNPDNLTTFLNYGYDNYKASKYSLILWDHGGGPIYGYGRDENYAGALTLSLLKQAFDNSPFKNKKLEFVGFDACLMSSIEVASLFSNYANYMIASQEVEPGYGWDYSFLGEVTKSTSTVDLGMSIINHYGEFYKKNFIKGITLSLLDLSKVKDVEEKLDDLFKDVDNNLVIDYSNVSRTRNLAKSFGKVSANSLYDLVDLYDLTNKLPSTYSTKTMQVKGALDTLVVAQNTDLANAYGVSIYFPFENKKYVNNIMYVYQQFGFAPEYTKFIVNFSSKLMGNRLNNWKLTDSRPNIDSSDVISVTVPTEVSQNYSSANYVIFEKINDTYYMPRFKGTDIEVDGDVFSTTISKKGLVAYNDKEAVYLTAVESEKGKNYVKYLIPSILQKWGSKMSENFTMESAYVEFVIDNDNPDGVITGAVPIISEEENLVAPKLSYELKDWKLVQFWNASYKIFNADGSYTTDWESSGSLSGIEFKLDEEFNLEFRDLDPSKEYYALFHISERQGNRYNTSMVRINL